ncbi:MAG: hypothetical protein MUF49_22055 [Oculatellaceae cyanobacterium Prado106]|jgi:hypothetical protein|nr:hypothetical protein [Oculatellaceae cyanobacterium Prado106]
MLDENNGLEIVPEISETVVPGEGENGVAPGEEPQPEDLIFYMVTLAEEKPMVQTPIARLLMRPDSFIEGSSGSDRLVGDNRSNGISGLAGNDVLLGLGSTDMISGDQGNDRIFGGAGGDLLYGGIGDDVIRGGAGDDYLQGDGGRDRLKGDAGADQFAIQKGKGTDIVLDYMDGQDKLATFNVNAEQLSFVQQGSNTLIKLNNETLAVLKNVRASVITVDDFVIPLPAVI